VQKYTHTFENEMNDAGFLQNSTDEHRASDARNALRSWYLRHARPLPWREKPSLYGTWLSEIMLQQTRVDTGIPKWHLFLELFPTVDDLAQASEAEVMKAWEGLGYYRRARLLHKAAKVVAAHGAVPKSREDWLALPDVGPYTSAAIAAFEAGIRRFVVAGGETSGAVAQALGLSRLDIGAEIAPGVPWTFSRVRGEDIAITLKSGNFGDGDFFATALARLEE